MSETKMFEVGKVYLLTHTHKAFGGGTWTAACKALTEKYIHLGERWYELSTVDENFVVLDCVGDYNFHATANQPPQQPQPIVEMGMHGDEE